MPMCVDWGVCCETDDEGCDDGGREWRALRFEREGVWMGGLNLKGCNGHAGRLDREWVRCRYALCEAFFI